jgi:hypothetical protein
MHEFHGRELFIQERPVRNKAGNGLCLERLFPHVMSLDQDAAPGGLEQACHHFDRRGLACPIRAEKTEDLAPRHFEVHVVDGHELAVILGEVDEFDHRTLFYRRGRRENRKA